MAEQVFAHTHTVNISTGDNVVNFTQRITGSTKIAKAIDVPDGSVNLEKLLNIIDEQVVSVVISSTKEVTFKINTSGGDPHVIGPTTPFVWKDGDADTPFGADVTKFLFTNASGAESRVMIQVIQSGSPEPTPTPTV